jgi:hypothetical protein
MLNNQNEISILKSFQPVTVAMRSKARNVFTHLSTGIMGLNPIRDIDVYLPKVYKIYSFITNSK